MLEVSDRKEKDKIWGKWIPKWDNIYKKEDFRDAVLTRGMKSGLLFVMVEIGGG